MKLHTRVRLLLTARSFSDTGSEADCHLNDLCLRYILTAVTVVTNLCVSAVFGTQL